MQHNARVLLDRYKLNDVARKVVGVGSVGTRCVFTLLLAKENDPLLLQIKEARHSVLEPYVRKVNSEQWSTGGGRPKIMQSASDMLLGWTTLRVGDYYIRQLKDMKLSAVIESQPLEMASSYVRACALVLAKAHGRSGDPALIAGYMGKGMLSTMPWPISPGAMPSNKERTIRPCWKRSNLVGYRPNLTSKRFCDGARKEQLDASRYRRSHSMV